MTNSFSEPRLKNDIQAGSMAAILVEMLIRNPDGTQSAKINAITAILIGSGLTPEGLHVLGMRDFLTTIYGFLNSNEMREYTKNRMNPTNPEPLDALIREIFTGAFLRDSSIVSEKTTEGVKNILSAK